MSAVETLQGTAPFSGRDRAYLGLLTSGALALGLAGISRMGYVGQDFVNHRAPMLLYPPVPLSEIYAHTNPPALYGFGSLVRSLVGARHDLAAVSLCFLAANTAALWIFYRLL
jgi:hypothetical protein